MKHAAFVAGFCGVNSTDMNQTVLWLAASQVWWWSLIGPLGMECCRNQMRVATLAYKIIYIWINMIYDDICLYAGFQMQCGTCYMLVLFFTAWEPVGPLPASFPFVFREFVVALGCVGLFWCPRALKQLQSSTNCCCNSHCGKQRCMSKTCRRHVEHNRLCLSLSNYIIAACKVHQGRRILYEHSG